ncbi:MAG: copper-translocating P-type ATPase [Candidatus Omnitrophica bacterium]|nr:copper-translocating P-type ATPase [Candidatus Omnitrophota bacterium]
MMKDPICGMEVEERTAIKLERDGKTYFFCSQSCKNKFLTGAKTQFHVGHHAHMVEEFKKRFWISLIATIPVLFLSPMIQSFFRFHLSFPGDKFLLLVISTFIYFYGGKPFLKGLFDELKRRQPAMMTLVGLAITIAYVYSSLVVLGLKGEIFFWELVTLIDIMLLGHWIEMKSVIGASAALEELARLLPSEAHLILEDGSIRDVRLEELNQEDKILVKPGEKIPVDGYVIDGESEVNEAMLTGESKPISKKVKDNVIGGSINGSGLLKIKVKKTGKDSYISQVVELVRIASESKSKIQDLANRAAFWLTIIAISAGIFTLISWLISGKEFTFALERMVTVMIITCPHALGLAVPLVVAVITGILAKNGLLIRNRTAFENARNLDIVVFDKTGTLTKGELGVTDIVSLGDWSKEELLRRVVSIEINSEHSIAKGIVNKAKEINLSLYKVSGFEAIPGKGARAYVEGEEMYIGNKMILEKTNLKLDDELEKKINEISSQGKTTVFVVSGGKVQGIIGLTDIIRDESKEAVNKLKSLGLEIAMITGDNYLNAKYVADELGLNVFFSEVLAQEKLKKIKELQQKGKRVCMVGDGVNDAPALAVADVGIAIGAGTDVAVESADVVLVKNDPRNVVDVISLSQIMQRKMIQNLLWAWSYNVFAIPLAIGVLYNYGVILPPAVGAVIMSLSTVVVAINARLISYKRQ